MKTMLGGLRLPAANKEQTEATNKKAIAKESVRRKLHMQKHKGGVLVISDAAGKPIVSATFAFSARLGGAYRRFYFLVHGIEHSFELGYDLGMRRRDVVLF